MWNRPTRLVLSVVALSAAAVVLANDFSLDWWTIDAGGEMWTTDGGGNFELSGSIGQPDAGSVMVGGTFELTGGFWPGVEQFCFGDIEPEPLGGDGDVDLADLAQLLANYGKPSGATYWEGDLDGDGDVDLSDLAALLSVYGDPCP